jgi:hypothetical protein
MQGPCAAGWIQSASHQKKAVRSARGRNTKDQDMEADMNFYKTLMLSGLLMGLFACKTDNLIVGEGDGYDSGAGGQTGTGNTGGSPAAGGVLAAGGAEELGGSVGSGGDLSTGGAIATVDLGTGGGGGSPVQRSGNVVTFVNGMAQGAMAGPGWVAMGTVETVTSPTCMGAPITYATPCLAQTTWNNPNALCVVGMIPALPPVPTSADYANNWGIQVGVSAGEPSGVVGLSFSTIALTVTGPLPSGLRAEIHRLGDPDSTFYCANLISGAKIALTAFNTTCWDGLGVPFTLADAPKIDRVSVQVSATFTATPVTNLCLSRIVFGN